MFLSDTSVTRPVFASVLSLLLIVFGVISFNKLPLREYPDINPPVVSIDTVYSGASANIVETKITKVIEDRISGIEGVKFIDSTSRDGRSRINIEFNVDRNIDNAANDIRDRVSGILDNLPFEAQAPDIQKADSSDDVIIWLNLESSKMNTLELTDYAKRYLENKFSVLPGVARVRIGGGLEYAMRIWLDRSKMAARGLTVNDIENAIRKENVELPAGSIESDKMQFTARIKRVYQTPEDFSQMTIMKKDNYLIRLSDVAKIEKAASENRTFFSGNGVPMIGIGIVKQSKANIIDVANEAIKLAENLSKTLPEGMEIINAYDTSVFVRNAILEVYKTLFVAIVLVALVIYLFLGTLRAMFIPAVTVPVSLIATFIVLYMLNFSINILTLLALVLSIGLVVDDAIVVLENISRRIENKEPALSAAFYGTRQVGFAVIATTIVLIAVFLPITFLEGDLGRLFSEFAITMAAAVSFSTFVAVTLCPMLASKMLKNVERTRLTTFINEIFEKIKKVYGKVLYKSLKYKTISILSFIFVVAISAYLLNLIPKEYAPKEDRGAFFVLVTAPEGASYKFTKEYMEEIERRLMPYVKSGVFTRLLTRAPRSFGGTSSFNDGIAIAVLDDWSKRKSGFLIMQEVMSKLSDLPGVKVYPVMRQGFRGSAGKPVRFVIGGGTYEQLIEWRDIIINKIDENNPGFIDIDSDFKETKPQLSITVRKNRAADLGVSIETIGRTLETMLGSRQITTYIDNGEEYDVILEGVRDSQRTPTDMQNIYVKSTTSGKLIPLSNLIKIEESADSNSLNRYNKIRSITIEAGLKDNYSLNEALEFLRNIVKNNIKENVVIDYKGESLDYQKSKSSLIFIFCLSFLIVFLVLAAQFESFIHPLIIILTVPFAITGALFGIYLIGGSLNVYTQIGLIMLIGLSAKNGILIVEFINQKREEGVEFFTAIVDASLIRFRPIMMTSITTIAGSLPLIFTFGAGAETRLSIGIVILSGVIASTFFTLFIVPVAYDLLAKNTKPSGYVKNQLEKEKKDTI